MLARKKAVLDVANYVSDRVGDGARPVNGTLVAKAKALYAAHKSKKFTNGVAKFKARMTASK